MVSEMEMEKEIVTSGSWNKNIDTDRLLENTCKEIQRTRNNKKRRNKDTKGGRNLQQKEKDWDSMNK